MDAWPEDPRIQELYKGSDYQELCDPGEDGRLSFIVTIFTDRNIPFPYKGDPMQDFLDHFGNSRNRIDIRLYSPSKEEDITPDKTVTFILRPFPPFQLDSVFQKSKSSKLRLEPNSSRFELKPIEVKNLKKDLGSSPEKLILDYLADNYSDYKTLDELSSYIGRPCGFTRGRITALRRICYRIYGSPLRPFETLLISSKTYYCMPRNIAIWWKNS
jgi:hypothetical protein